MIKEKLTKGQLPQVTIKSKIARTRIIKDFDGNVRLNKALWTLAES